VTDEEVVKLATDYLPHIHPDADERLLLALCRDIERQARHDAVKQIYAAAWGTDCRMDIRRALDRMDMEAKPKEDGSDV